MDSKSLLLAAALPALAACAPKTAGLSPWTEEKACEWYSSQPWPSGCNYIPCDAINQIEMWSASTWNPALIDKELGWAEELGFNTMRVFLSSEVYRHEGKSFKSRVGEFLDICNTHGIRPMFVIFDDCWDPESAYGPQRAPKPGVHNSGWVQDPSAARRADSLATWPELETYVKDMLRSFGHDGRVLCWDLYNEPGNSGYGESSLPLLRDVFRWAREEAPSQPVTAGVWTASLGVLNKFQLENSDIISFHDYGEPSRMTGAIDSLSRRGRPLFCTEYMARTRGSFFGNIMPLLRERNVAAINWGFVAGKTNTIFAWNTPLPDATEPPVWFHDILRPDGSPFDEGELEVIRRCNAVVPAN